MSLPLETGLDLFALRLGQERLFAVLITTSPSEPEPQVSVVNVAVVAHHRSGNRVVALVVDAA